MKQTLYQVAEVYRHALQFVFDESAEDGEITPDLVAIMNAVQGDFDEKIISCAAVVRELQHLAEANKAESRRLAERAKRFEENLSRLTHYMKTTMESVECRKVNGELFTVSVVSNPPAVEVTDVRLLPPEYVEEVTTLKIHKSEISAAVKAGEVVPGAELKYSTRLKIQ